jgi:small subunit ribosomal protein S9
MSEEKKAETEMHEEKKEDVVQKKKKKSRKKGIISKAKKKRAVARATIKRGTGKIKVNRRLLELTSPNTVYKMINEPLEMAEELRREVDISVNVKGGGFMSQAVAVRAAIAKALLEFRSNQKLKEAFIKRDKLMLVDDPRRVESKKPLGPKARKKKQKSKR